MRVSTRYTTNHIHVVPQLRMDIALYCHDHGYSLSDTHTDCVCVEREGKREKEIGRDFTVEGYE
jgi:hypothetical protein